MAYGYQGPSMTPGASVASVIDRIRQQRQQARELAAEERKTKMNIGMGALKFDSSLRAWQMARVAKPDLTYGEFIMNPTAGGVYQKKAANMIMGGEAEMPKMMSLKRYTDLFKGKGKGDVDLKKELEIKKPKVKTEVKTEEIDTSSLYEGAFRTDPTDVPSTFGSGDELVYPLGTKQGFLGQGGTSMSRAFGKIREQERQERADMVEKGGGEVPSADPDDMDLTQLSGEDMVTEEEWNEMSSKAQGKHFDTDVEPDPPSEDFLAQIQKTLAEPDIATDEQGNVITEMPSGAINPELKGEIKSADEYRERLQGYVDESQPGDGPTPGGTVIKPAEDFSKNLDKTRQRQADAKARAAQELTDEQLVAEGLEMQKLHETLTETETMDPDLLQKALAEPLKVTDTQGNVVRTLDAKKTEGLKGLLQRSTKGGKSGYRGRTEQELIDELVKKEKPIKPEVDIEPDLPDDIEDILAKPGDVKTEGASLGDAAGTAGDIVGGATALHTLYNADPSDIEIGDVKAGLDVAKLGAKGAAKMGSEGGAALGQTLGKAAPWVSVAMSVNTLADKKSTDTQKAGALMSAAGAVAMTNFWNPAGWVAGALMVGGTLASLFGGKAQKPKRKTRAATGYRGGSGYSYV